MSGEAAKLLRVRGLAMQAAVPVGAGAMAALLGVECDAAAAIAKQAAEETGDGAICEVANDNGGGQVVVSGSSAAVHRAIEIAKEQGARRSVLLPVSAPFHCALMQPAAEAMAAALGQAAIKPPCVPLVSNVLAAPVTEPDEIRKLLVAQVTGDGALARKHGLHGGEGNFGVRRMRRRKSLVGACQKDCWRGARRFNWQSRPISRFTGPWLKPGRRISGVFLSHV